MSHENPSIVWGLELVYDGFDLGNAYDVAIFHWEIWLW